jgi:hypothetical protein
MEKTFKFCDRKQMLLLPPSLLDWLPEGHLAHFILDTVEQLDLIRSGAFRASGPFLRAYYPDRLLGFLLVVFTRQHTYSEEH